MQMDLLSITVNKRSHRRRAEVIDSLEEYRLDFIIQPFAESRDV